MPLKSIQDLILPKYVPVLKKSVYGSEITNRNTISRMVLVDTELFDEFLDANFREESALL